MKSVLRPAALAGLFLLTAGAASAAATVTYAQPDRFSDVPFTPWEREQILKDLSAHFDKLAAGMPAGQELSVEVLDVDLAGQTWPARWSGHDIRVMNGRADWPSIKLRYAITQGGQVVRSGEDDIRNMSYMQGVNRYYGGDALRYEKQMLDKWFRERIAAR